MRQQVLITSDLATMGRSQQWAGPVLPNLKEFFWGNITLKLNFLRPYGRSSAFSATHRAKPVLERPKGHVEVDM